MNKSGNSKQKIILPNQIIHNDCFELLDFIPDASIDLMLTDIPYVVSRKSNFHTMKDRKNERVGVNFGEWDEKFVVKDLALFIPKLKKDSTVVIFHSMEQFDEVRHTFMDKGWKNGGKIFWRKTNPFIRNRDRMYISDVEMGSWYVRENWTFNRQGKYVSMLFTYPSESGANFKRYHPTQKPLKLFKELIKIHSNSGDVVFDPFAGSGTTGVASIELDRKYILVEAEEEYFHIMKKRIIGTKKNQSQNLLELLDED